MNLYEQLEDEACKDGIEVIDYDFKSKNIRGTRALPHYSW